MNAVKQHSILLCHIYKKLQPNGRCWLVAQDYAWLLRNVLFRGTVGVSGRVGTASKCKQEVKVI